MCDVQTYHVLLAQIQREVFGYDRSILQKNFVDGLKEGGYKENVFNFKLASFRQVSPKCEPLQTGTLSEQEPVDLDTPASWWSRNSGSVAWTRPPQNRRREHAPKSAETVAGKKRKGRKGETEGAKQWPHCPLKENIFLTSITTPILNLWGPVSYRQLFLHIDANTEAKRQTWRYSKLLK